MPDDERRPTLQGVVAGTLGQVRDEGPIILTSATASPGLAASAAPAADDIPNNHIFYAFQWFFFAAAAALIYVLALRRRLSGGR
jgi:cytochrome oxidase assembly protein ShyY1